MDVLIILIFVSTILVAAGVLLFLKSFKEGDFEHGDRLSLLPLEDDDPVATTRPAVDGESEGERVDTQG